MSYSISSSCTGCSACARFCPVQAITGTPKEPHGILEKRCVSCGVCGRVCPAGAVLDDGGMPCAAVPRSRWQKPVIDTAVCSACGMCVAVCRAEALCISQPTRRGDYHLFAELAAPKKCVGCALCVRECPLHAIIMQEDSVT